MKLKRNRALDAVWYEVAGFLVLIAITWANELGDLSRWLFGGSSQTDWHEAAFESLAIILVAVPTIWLTYRLVSRLHYLEGFLHLCAWCRKLEYQGKWMPLEEFFESGLATQTSHGICPECFAKVVKE